ncbi:MAG: histidinol-phosphatase HisJ family protein [Lachnospiraceae bacterium]|uniref:Histidinol-phosphatase n=1 Tax=Dorea phocaeensis TaxID=2040291 RepID=A0A850HJV5_9FIRM|nr:histidinol-phosphatase HisJ family protein [Dorea phocaeensis]MBS5131671.1 histidinol-phosphatase HisJ family protein [Lachnospiraceae bacterium]NSK13598.1 histidinol-phosphatase HisJ family protein [Dorea phocaeensis]NVH57273.1 histidinol-phosphatase HisJ family protein [Dorea phocaeensis]
MRADVHMHTNFSHDSEALPEEMIQGAIQKGLEMICITDHFDKDNMEWGAEDIFDPEAYFQVLRPLQEKYQGKIRVNIGVEIGMQPYLAPFYQEFVEKYPFDFVIGSVHSIWRRDIAAGSVFEGRTDEEVYRATLEETLEDVRLHESFDVLGHLDYMTRYGSAREQEYSYRRYQDLIDEILKTLISKGKGLELNTAGLKYGLPYAHPHQDVLRRYRELGGEILTVGADGHKPEHIAYDFDRGIEILRDCGFRYYTEFQDRKPVFRAL